MHFPSKILSSKFRGTHKKMEMNLTTCAAMDAQPLFLRLCMMNFNTVRFLWHVHRIKELVEVQLYNHSRELERALHKNETTDTI